jgi:small basic protein
MRRLLRPLISLAVMAAAAAVYGVARRQLHGAADSAVAWDNGAVDVIND